MIVLAWLLVLRAPGSFEQRCDRYKAFYNRRAWPFTSHESRKDTK